MRGISSELNFYFLVKHKFKLHFVVLAKMARKRMGNQVAQKVDEIFDVAQDDKNTSFNTPENLKYFRPSRYDISYPSETRFSTPVETTKRHSLDPSLNSPYNYYSFSSSEAMWKLRLKASETKILPYEKSKVIGNKSSISPVRLKGNFIWLLCRRFD